MTAKQTLSIAVIVAAALVADGALAETADEAAGKAMFADGNQLFASGDYVGALERFQGAYARTKNPKVMLNLGTTLRALGRFAEAATTYEAYLKDPKADPAKRAEVEAALKDVLQRVATLRIGVDGEGRVLVDAKEVGRGPGTVQVRVDRGVHTIELEDGKGAPVTTRVEVVAGEDRAVKMRRDAEPAVAPTTGPAPPASASRPAARWPTSSYVMMGVGGAFLGVAVYSSLRSKTEYDNASAVKTSADCARGTVPGCQDYKDQANDLGDRWKYTTWGTAGVGVMAIATGVYLGATSGQAESSRMRIQPVVTGDLRGVWLARRW